MKTLSELKENLIEKNQMLLVKGGAGETEPACRTEEDGPIIDEPD